MLDDLFMVCGLLAFFVYKYSLFSNLYCMNAVHQMFFMALRLQVEFLNKTNK